MAKRSEKKKVVVSRTSTNVTTTSVGVQGVPSLFRRDWLWGLILILVVILAYTPVWKAGFVWDDEGILTANPCIVGPLGLKEIWTTSAADICPLTLTTFWVEHALLETLGTGQIAPRRQPQHAVHSSRFSTSDLSPLLKHSQLNVRINALILR